MYCLKSTWQCILQKDIFLNQLGIDSHQLILGFVKRPSVRVNYKFQMLNRLRQIQKLQV